MAISGALVVVPSAHAGEPHAGKIVYATPTAIESLAPDGTESELYAVEGHVPQLLKVSPDGSKVAFLDYIEASGRRMLVVIDLVSGEARTLAGPKFVVQWVIGRAGEPEFGAWSNDSSKIAFLSDGGKKRRGLWVVDAGSGKKSRVRAGDVDQPAWNRTDSKLAFTYFKGTTTSQRIGYVSVVDGKFHQVLDKMVLYGPKWSPTKDVLVAYDRDGRLFAINKKNKKTLLSSASGYVRNFVWLPDGSGVAAASCCTKGYVWKLSFLYLDGSIEKVIDLVGVAEEEDYYYYLDPLEFSPDGTEFAYQEVGFDEIEYESFHNLLYIAPASGASSAIVHNVDWFSYRSWSPDSDAILICMNDGLGYLVGDTYTTLEVPHCDADWAP
ncbi:MAG: PD40 domain-containing protein [Actinobacteria bacterium]|nr:PD40 domain-containing protein [Actinomycetota bacterium]